MLGTKKDLTGFPRKEMTTLVTIKTEQIKKKSFVTQSLKK
jgi:hypothetical protein